MGSAESPPNPPVATGGLWAVRSGGRDEADVALTMPPPTRHQFMSWVWPLATTMLEKAPAKPFWVTACTFHMWPVEPGVPTA